MNDTVTPKFTYKLDVLDELKDYGYTAKDLVENHLLTKSVIRSLREYKMVSLQSLATICMLLNRDIGDIIQSNTTVHAGHIWADWIDKQLQAFPKADISVLKFIQDIVTRLPGKYDTIVELFTQGYCYHFAQMLQHTFGRGRLCVPGFRGHVVWLDGNDPEHDIAYDVNGVYDYYGDELGDLIPVEYFGPCINTFLHCIDKPDIPLTFENRMTIQRWRDLTKQEKYEGENKT